MKTDTRDQRRRLTREDWVAEATEVLATRGLSAVAVEPLAERLGVTKGSFYAHFANRDELVGRSWSGGRPSTPTR